MNYHSMMFASALAFSGLAGAADAPSVSQEEMADYKIECLESAFSDELSGDQKDAYVKDCVQQKLAAKGKPKDKNT
jgi:hypothetical protein